MEKIIKKVVESPALALAHIVNMGDRVSKSVSGHRHVKKGKEYWESLGPGLTTGASDDDPSGIATYSQAGAQYGFQFLWLSLYTFPLMVLFLAFSTSPCRAETLKDILNSPLLNGPNSSDSTKSPNGEEAWFH